MYSAFIVPRLGPGRRDDFTIIKEQRMKHRLEEINNAIKTQNYYDWLATQKEQSVTADSIWWVPLASPAAPDRLR